MNSTKEKNLIRSKQKYGMISQNIMRHSFITATAKALYGYLAGFAGSENTAFPGRDLICYEMGLNKDTLLKYMWELQVWEIIQIEKTRGDNGQWDKNLYILDHYPSFVMMERKEFEEIIWPELQQQIKSKGNKSNTKNPPNMATSPCPKISDTAENGLPCPEIPCPENSGPVQPDPVVSDINNNSFNNNSFNNNSFNNNSINNVIFDLVPNAELDPSVVDDSITEIKKNEDRQEVDSKLQVTHGQIKEKFDACGICDLPEKVIKVLQIYTYDEISKIAVTLQNKRKQGKVINPVGLIVTHPEIIQAILKDEFLPDVPKETKEIVDAQKRSWDELYVPPEELAELAELKNQKSAMS